MPDPILPEALRQRVAALRFRVRRARAGGQKGERRSTQRGTSIEFADYRSYAPGDDLRRLDWNAYARLDRPIVKLYEDEQDVLVHVLLDDSASMGALDSAAARRKQAVARQVAAALGFIALNSGDRVTLTRLSQAAEPAYSGSGRAAAAGLVRVLAGSAPAGALDLAAALRTFAQREKRAGLAFLISDLFTQSAPEEVLRLLPAAGHETIVLHTLASDERAPDLSGDVRLVDVESGDAREVAITAGLYEQYQAALRAWMGELRAACVRRGAVYVPVQADAPLEALLLRDLRRAGVVI